LLIRDGDLLALLPLGLPVNMSMGVERHRLTIWQCR
jgi:hypothetical protein